MNRIVESLYRVSNILNEDKLPDYDTETIMNLIVDRLKANLPKNVNIYLEEYPDNKVSFLIVELNGKILMKIYIDKKVSYGTEINGKYIELCTNNNIYVDDLLREIYSNIHKNI